MQRFGEGLGVRARRPGDAIAGAYWLGKVVFK